MIFYCETVWLWQQGEARCLRSTYAYTYGTILHSIWPAFFSLMSWAPHSSRHWHYIILTAPPAAKKGKLHGWMHEIFCVIWVLCLIDSDFLFLSARNLWTSERAQKSLSTVPKLKGLASLRSLVTATCTRLITFFSEEFWCKKLQILVFFFYYRCMYLCFRTADKQSELARWITLMECKNIQRCKRNWFTTRSLRTFPTQTLLRGKCFPIYGCEQPMS